MLPTAKPTPEVAPPPDPVSGVHSSVVVIDEDTRRTTERRVSEIWLFERCVTYDVRVAGV